MVVTPQNRRRASALSSAPTPAPGFGKRQTPSVPDDDAPAPPPQTGGSLPPCVGTCLLLGNFSDCGGPSDMACLCASSTYIGSVDACFRSQCSPEQALIGVEYSSGACLMFGVNVSTIAYPSASVSAGVDMWTPPDVYSHTFINLQAIMSSICSALIVVALVIGFLSFRARKRKESASHQGSWTNMATYASRGGGPGTGTHGHGGKSFTTSRGGVGLNSGFDPTATYASSSYPLQTKSFGQTVSFGDVTGGGAGGGAGGMERSRGFTNRLRLDEQEEWEMETKERGAGAGILSEVEEGEASAGPSSRGSKDDLKEDVAGPGPEEPQMSPVTPTTIGGRSELEVAFDASTAALTRLDKEEGTGRAY